MKRNGMKSVFAVGAILALSAFTMADGGHHGSQGNGNSHSNGNGNRYDDRWDRDRRDDGRRDDRRREDRWRNDDRWRQDDRWRPDDRWRNDDRRDEFWRREETKQEWRNIGKAAGFLSLLGALDRDRTLVFAGQVGSLYAAYRYDEDCRSQDRIARARSVYFSQPYFYRDGCRYERRTVYQRGMKYYQFVRCD